MDTACIDLEGVLIPELWPMLANATGIKELAQTTREVPDYRALMQRRLHLLRTNELRLVDVQYHIQEADLEPGAAEFLRALEHRCEVLLVSDAFSQMVEQIISRIAVRTTLLCHTFLTDEDGFIDQCLYASRNGKEDVVRKLQSQGHKVLAVGDAFNDLQMLQVADRGYLFRPSAATRHAAPELPVAEDYFQIKEAWGTQTCANSNDQVLLELRDSVPDGRVGDSPHPHSRACPTAA